jgi:aldehyde dehydrogenase (NAD+)
MVPSFVILLPSRIPSQHVPKGADMTSDVLAKLGLSDHPTGAASGARAIATDGPDIVARSPIDGAMLATIRSATPDDVSSVISAAQEAFVGWRVVPAPVRGELVRRFGMTLREHKQALAELVTLEAGKIIQEALGEVQEMIDICDFAVGLSRQLYGLTIASERKSHRMMEQWHPLGPVGVISAFNFPVAVWAWNAAIALVCGDPVVWKPSEKTPLTAIASHALLIRTIEQSRDLPIPEGLCSYVIGDGATVGEPLAQDERLPLVSATGSVRMGRRVGQVVAERLGRSLLELGGNNAMIVMPSADLELATRAIVFAAAGTAGQRCTTLRRLIVHRDIRDELLRRLTAIYTRLRIGDPRQPGVLVGPLIDEPAGQAFDHAVTQAREQGGTVLVGGGRVREGVPVGGVYVQPTIISMPTQTDVVREETFAPILYVMTVASLEEAIALHNDVPQGLSSAIFTSDLREAEVFLSPAGSDCGIANVNIGTSGAEIGGAFGGEKQTGGGRESGSDAWKAYMRRATNTINYSRDLPLAQGISFEV